MVKRQVKILNESGLHARPASDFVKLAADYDSDITIRNAETDEEPVDAKSIMFLLAKGYGQGTVVELVADGDDAQEAVDALANFLETHEDTSR